MKMIFFDLICIYNFVYADDHWWRILLSVLVKNDSQYDVEIRGNEDER